MRDHAPDTSNTGTPEVLSEDLMICTSGKLAGGPYRLPAPLFPYPAALLPDEAGAGRAPITSSRSERAPDHSRKQLIKDLAGDCVGVFCLFFILFAGLFFGGIQ